ncbi:hypothetical protein M514_00514 [Trichuris suis]|uniref:ENTH domain-containing protein n=1 Tax=Trichuris suis TaxID=68888 RepID=A0A085NRL5_9BILA|nr:hypothetical protein M513_00514 [Trichuris suis]KFD72111.1 hypothetical protein M514_00514 [Trichuris suis]
MDKVLHAPMPFTAGGQTINDRLTAAYHSLAGSQLAKTVCKATTEEVMGPKKKHLDYLLHCSHEPNVSIPQLANLLVERTQNTNWCVVYKALITIHNLMCYGNERFLQYLASSNADFNLGNFLDKTSVQGYDMSTHIRRYAKYIGDKVYTYRLMAFDFCKVKRGREDGLLRTMPVEKLMKTLPVLQGQIDSLLEFQARADLLLCLRVSPVDLTNGVINSCFILMFRDLIRLFACYNDGIINLLEKYFEMNKKQCREALDLYKKFLTRMDKVAEFLKVAESVGIDRGEIPDLAKAPSSLLEALEQHLIALEGQKGVNSRLTSPSGTVVNLSLQQPQQQTQAKQAPTFDSAVGFDPALYQKYVDQEREQLNYLKEQKMLKDSANMAPPFVAAPPAKPAVSTASNPFVSPEPTAGKEEDLLMLSTNPFADSLMLTNVQQPQAPPPAQLYPTVEWNQPAAPVYPFAVNGHSQNAMTNVNSNFVTEESFSRAFDRSQVSQKGSASVVGEGDAAISRETDQSKQSGTVRSSESAAEIIAKLKQNAQALSSATCSKGKPPTGIAPQPLPPPVAGTFKQEQPPQAPPPVDTPPVPPPLFPTLPRRPSLDESTQPGPPPSSGDLHIHSGEPPADITHGGVYLDTPFSNTDASYSNANSPAVQHRQFMVNRHEMAPTQQQEFKPTNVGEDTFMRQIPAGATYQEPSGMTAGGGAASQWMKDSGTFKSSAGNAAVGGGLITQEKGGKIDLESTIANLAENLTIDRGQDGKSPRAAGQRVGLTPNVNPNPVSSIPPLSGGYYAGTGAYGAGPMPTSYMPYAAANQSAMMHGHVAPMMGQTSIQVPMGFYGQQQPQQHAMYPQAQPFVGMMPAGGLMQNQSTLQSNGSFWSSTGQAPPTQQHQPQQQNVQSLQDPFGAL